MPQSTRPVHLTHLIALTLILWVLGGTAFFPPPAGVPSTYAAALALFGGVLWVIFLTWRNAMGTDSVANLLHRTETEPARARSVVRRAEGDTHGRTR